MCLQGPSGEQQAGLVKAEHLLAQAQKAVAARKADAAAAAEALEACQKRLTDAKAAAAQNKSKQPAGGSNGVLANGVAAGGVSASPSKQELDERFALPECLREYTGEDTRDCVHAGVHKCA